MVKDFFKTNFFTGFIALLPVALLVVIISWLYKTISNLIQPITLIFGTQGLVTDLLAILSIVVIIFLIGLTIRTTPGIWLSRKFENSVLLKLPGYRIIKEIIEPLKEKGYQKSFKSVVLVNIYESSLLVTGFVTDKSIKKGYTTVFIPTGPNPTSGQIVHVKNKFVHPVDIPMETVIKTVIAVGSGSKKLLENMKK